MKFLVTNDDGYLANGLRVVVNYLKTLGEVVIVAPMHEQSAKSHGINIRNAFEIEHIEDYLGCDTYVVDSTPADCVRYAIYGLHMDDIDYVVSGINNGYNLGDDILYSGTCGAATEAALRGIKAIALSCECGEEDIVKELFPKVKDIIEREHLFDKWSLWNINIPKEFKDFEITHQGSVYFDTYFAGSRYKKQCGTGHREKDTEEGSDVCAINKGHLSIMPMSYDKTKYF